MISYAIFLDFAGSASSSHKGLKRDRADPGIPDGFSCVLYTHEMNLFRQSGNYTTIIKYQTTYDK